MKREVTKIAKNYQCKDCIYSYNPSIGDPKQGVKPGTLFEDLPQSWVCPICNASKHRFKPIT